MENNDSHKFKKASSENGLFIMGGTILICSVFFGVFFVLSYARVYKTVLVVGILLGILIILSGCYLASLAFGMLKIIEQNKKILKKLEEMDKTWEF